MIITFVRKYIILRLFVLIVVVDCVVEGRALMSTKLRVSRSAVPDYVWNNKRSHLWPNGQVPFLVDPSLANKRSFINKAFNYFHQHTCIRFVVKKDHEDYLVINKTSPNGNCTAGIGRIENNKQELYLSDGYCFWGANILHELLHILGFIHEHTRPDREEYVELNYERINEQFKNTPQVITENFDINEKAVTLSPYDYVSVMHYGRKYVKKLKKPGAVIFDPAENGYGLSELDLKHLKELYNCSMDGQ